MKGPRLELADIVRRYGSAYLARYGKATFFQQRGVLKDIALCRTAALGGHVRQCDQCGHTDVSYDSCRNRHCPKCQAAARAEWMEARAQDLLETVEYYHAVFTLPDELAPVALQNKEVLYNLLFRSVSETLKTIAGDPKRLGADIGFLAILHTWGQTLRHHAHIHCVIPGGGLSPDGHKWISCRKGFFLPVRVLSSLVKKKFLSLLKEAHNNKKLSFHGELKPLASQGHWMRFLKPLYKKKWVVYVKPPFGGAEQVLKYLARYTHRVAISNQRLLSLQDGNVRFQWKDYRNGHKQRTMTLDAVEFLRRFLLHVFPKGFVHIRYYGFLANRNRKKKIALCRRLLGLSEKSGLALPETSEESTDESQDNGSTMFCPICKKGRMMEVDTVRPDPAEGLKLLCFLVHDTR
jgi:hypothetical protein